MVCVWDRPVNFVGNGFLVLTFTDRPDDPISFGEGFTGSGTTTLTLVLADYGGAFAQIGDEITASIGPDFCESVSGSVPNADIPDAGFANNSLITPLELVSITLVDNDPATCDVVYSGAVTISGPPDLRIGTGGWISAGVQYGTKTARVSNKSVHTGSNLVGLTMTQGWRDPHVRGAAQGAYVNTGQAVIEAP